MGVEFLDEMPENQTGKIMFLDEKIPETKPKVVFLDEEQPKPIKIAFLDENPEDESLSGKEIATSLAISLPVCL